MSSQASLYQSEENSISNSSGDDFDKMDDDDDWAKDLGLEDSIPLKLPTLNLPDLSRSKILEKKPSVLFPDDDDDWDNPRQIPFPNPEQIASPPMVITGIKADPSQKEADWDEDFEWGPDDAAPLGLKKTGSPLALSRNLSSNVVKGFASNEQTLKDLIQRFPDPTGEKKPKRKLKIKDTANEKLQESKAIFELGIMCFESGDYADAMKHFQKAQSALQSANEPKYEAEVLYHLGATSRLLGRHSDAINSLKQVMDAPASKRPTKAMRVRLNFELGACYANSENFNMSLHHFAEAFKEASRCLEKLDWVQVGKACLTAGHCSMKLLYTSLARDFFKKAVSISQKIGNESIGTEAKNMLKNFAEEKEKDVSDVEFSEEDDENWDADIGIEDQRRTLALPGQASPGPAVKLKIGDENALPLKYKLLESTLRDVEIIKFPKATVFTTLTKQHRLNEEEMDNWLNTIITKNEGSSKSPRRHLLDSKQSDEAVKQNLVVALQPITKFSLEWALTYYDTCCLLAAQERHEKLWEILFECFLDLKDISAKAKDPVVIHVMQQLVYLAAKMWRAEEKLSFCQILQAMRHVDASQNDLMTLTENETYAHHKHGDLEKDALGYIEAFAQIYKKNRTEGTFPRMFNQSMKADLSAVQSIDDSKVSLTESSPNEIAARALCDIHFLLADISPLTCLHRDMAEEEDEDEAERKGFTGTERNLRLDQVSDLVDASTRYDCLLKLYVVLHPSFLKAKCAYALGEHAAFGLSDCRLAEQFFFECVYILDHLKPRIPGAFPLISELGTNALTKYADMLLTNMKYFYAISSYASAAACCKIRERDQRKSVYFSLLRRLATIAMDNNDHRRSIEYYKDILNTYTEEHKHNESRFVCETISSLYLVLGDFAEAGDYLAKAFSFPMPNPPSNDKLDPITFRLLLKQADLYLDSFNFDRGVEALENLNAVRNNLPVGGRSTVLTKLAKAYIKKGWYKECSSILARLDVETSRENPTPPPTITSPTNRFSDKKKMKYWELSGLNYFHSEQYADALCCIENALSECPSSSLSSLAHFYYLRGKVFQELCKTQLIFPLVLKTEKVELKSVTQIKYTGYGDLIQECVWSYDKAYNYFKAIGDDLHIAKTVSRIAAVYLDRVFAPVALMNVPFNDLSRFPAFFPSGKERDETLRKSSPRKHNRSKSDSSVERKDTVYEITFERIENPAMCALDIAADMAHPWLMAICHLNLAELNWLMGEKDRSIAFWSDVKDQLFSLFIDGTSFLGKGTPPGFLKKFSRILKRLTRLLFCFDQDFINRVIDATLMLEMDVSQSRRRPLASLRTEPRPDEKEGEQKSNSFGKSSKVAGISPAFTQPATPRPNLTTVFENAKSPPPTQSTAPQKPEEKSREKIELQRYTSIEDCRSVSAEIIWTFIYAIQVEVQNYTQGKISQEEVVAKNRKNIRKILGIRKANDQVKASILSGAPMEVSPLTRSRSQSGPTMSHIPTFDEISQTYKDLSKLVYIIQVEDYLFYYVPGTGQKRIQRIGGRDEGPQLKESTFNLNMNLNIHFMADSDEFVSLQVSPSMTLDKILKFLCNKPYWEVEEIKRKASFWGSLGRNQSNPNVLKSKPRFVDRSPQFHARLVSLLNLLGLQLPNSQDSSTSKIKERRLSSSQLCNIAFAKKSNADFASGATPSGFASLTVSSHTTVQQIFTSAEMKAASAETPLTLFLYLSRTSSESDLHSPGSLQKDAGNRVLSVNQEMVDYLRSLITKDVSDDVDSSRKAVSDLVDVVFASLIDIIPYTEKTGYLTSLDKGVKVTSVPLSLICSEAMQVFPWELILGESVARYMTLQDLLSQFDYLKNSRSETTDVIPKYWGCYVSTNDRNFAASEDKRREWITWHLFYQLNIASRPPSCLRFGKIVTPYHTPLIKQGKRITAYKKQYKSITWFDVGMLESYSEVLELINSTRIAESASSIFLLTYTDMVECTELQILLMRCLPNCTFLFIPASKTKQVVVKLMKMHDEYLKAKTRPSSSIYQFLMTSVALLQAECAAPIAVFNCPRDVK